TREENEKLKDKYKLTDEELANLDPALREDMLDKLVNEPSLTDIALGALTTLGSGFLAGLALFGIGRREEDNPIASVKPREQTAEPPPSEKDTFDPDKLSPAERSEYEGLLKAAEEAELALEKASSFADSGGNPEDTSYLQSALAKVEKAKEALSKFKKEAAIRFLLATGGANTVENRIETSDTVSSVVEKYPIDQAEVAKPVSIERTKYQLTEQGQEEVKSLRESASKVDTQLKESDTALFNEKQALKREAIEKPLKDLQREIQELRTSINAKKDTISDYNSSADETLLAKLKKQETSLLSQTTTKLKELSQQEVKDRKNLPEQVRLQSLDSIMQNPYRSQLESISIQILSLDSKSAEYKNLKIQQDALSIKVNAFDSARETLLNPKTKLSGAGVAAEMLKNLNPDLPISRPTQSIVLENYNNRENLTPGYDPSGKVGGVLPGINYSGAEVSNTPKDHSSRGGNTAYHATDIALPYGTPYMPVAGGTAEVISSSVYGNLVKIKHDYGVETFYAHNSEVLVTNGQPVTSSTIIANVGNTGHVGTNKPTQAPWYGGSHIHYELRINNKLVPSGNFDWNKYKTEGQKYVDDYFDKYGPNSPDYDLVEKKK
ncbi:M23 family metallopeptidase, partial [Leptospira idonii]